MVSIKQLNCTTWHHQTVITRGSTGCFAADMSATVRWVLYQRNVGFYQIFLFLQFSVTTCNFFLGQGFRFGEYYSLNNLAILCRFILLKGWISQSHWPSLSFLVELTGYHIVIKCRQYPHRIHWLVWEAERCLANQQEQFHFYKPTRIEGLKNLGIVTIPLWRLQDEVHARWMRKAFEYGVIALNKQEELANWTIWRCSDEERSLGSSDWILVVFGLDGFTSK